MFLRNFIKRGLLDAVGRQPDFWVMLNAAGWLDKGVLAEEDLVEIQAAIDAKNTPQEAAETTDNPQVTTGTNAAQEIGGETRAVSVTTSEPTIEDVDLPVEQM